MKIANPTLLPLNYEPIIILTIFKNYDRLDVSKIMQINTL